MREGHQSGMTSIREWLGGLGLDRHADAFEAQEIDLEALPEITDEDLKDMGLPIGPRRKVAKAIRELDLEPEAIAKSEIPPNAPIGSSGEADRRQLTVMFCDLVGSTALSEKLDPEELRGVMQAYRKACSDVIGRYDGHVAQHLGDGVMVYFGWPTAHEDDAGRAVRAGLDIVAAVAALEVEAALAVRVGIATGLVVVGESGADEGSDAKLAVGETPNIAARVQGFAEPDTVAIAQSTRRLLGGAFARDDLGTHDARGVSGGLHVHRVLGEAEAESRFEAAAGVGLTPFVGRQSEVTQLVERWDQAKDREGQVVLLSDEPGIGKSRLIEMLRARIANESHTRLRYQCSPYHTNSPFYPFVDQIGRAAQFGRDESADDKIGKLRGLLALATDTPDPALAAFASLMMLDYQIADEASALSPGETKEHIAEALLGQLASLAEQQPLLVIFEDIQWIDPSSLEILDMIVERLPTLRVLAIFSFRAGFEPTWIGRPHVNVMILNRLSGRLAGDMVAHLSGDTNLTEAERTEIVDKTDGIPLFVEELTRTVLQTRDAAGNGLTIPVTLRDALMARLDALVGGERFAGKRRAGGNRSAGRFADD
jgi:class 3 adenylate cyclase